MTLTGNSFYFDWELSLMEWLQSNLSSAVLSVLSFFSFFGEELFLVLVLGFLYWSWDKEKGRAVGINIALACILNPMVKNVFLRRRPYMESERVALLREIAGGDPNNLSLQGYSFPSGHSTNAAALFGALAFNLKARIFAVLAVICPLLVAVSRVAVGAHFPTDVLVGLLLGYAIVLLCAFLQRKIHSHAVLSAVLLVITVPGFFYCRSGDYYTGMGILVGLLAAIPGEQKYVRFENTRCPVRMILRLVIGAALFFGLNTLLKLPFSTAFLDGGTFAALLVRCARYAVLIFLLFAVYPIAFHYTAKIGAGKEPQPRQ